MNTYVCINFTINNYAYQKDTNFKKVPKKSEEKPELQKRKSNLFNEKLELIKISKYTHKNIHTQQHYVLTHIGEKQWSKTTQHGLSVKGKKKKKKNSHTHTVNLLFTPFLTLCRPEKKGYNTAV